MIMKIKIFLNVKHTINTQITVLCHFVHHGYYYQQNVAFELGNCVYAVAMGMFASLIKFETEMYDIQNGIHCHDNNFLWYMAYFGNGINNAHP